MTREKLNKIEINRRNLDALNTFEEVLGEIENQDCLDSINSYKHNCEIALEVLYFVESKLPKQFKLIKEKIRQEKLKLNKEFEQF